MVLSLAEHNVLLGGEPGAGKSVTLSHRPNRNVITTKIQPAVLTENEQFKKALARLHYRWPDSQGCPLAYVVPSDRISQEAHTPSRRPTCPDRTCRFAVGRSIRQPSCFPNSLQEVRITSFKCKCAGQVGYDFRLVRSRRTYLAPVLVQKLVQISCPDLLAVIEQFEASLGDASEQTTGLFYSDNFLELMRSAGAHLTR